MKIAICISGEPREYINTYYSVKEWAVQNKADLFLHSWDSISKPGRNFYEKNEEDSIKKTDIKFIDNIEEDIVKRYQPIKHQIENKNKLIEFLNTEHIYHIPADQQKFINSNYGSISQWYSSQKANELKKQYEKQNGFVYDIQIKTRFDTFFSIPESNILNKIFAEAIQSDCIYTPWMHIRNNEIMVEYSTLIGSNSSQDILWENIIKELSLSRPITNYNPHDNFSYRIRNKNIFLKTHEIMCSYFKILRPSIYNYMLENLYKQKNFNEINKYINLTYREYRK